MPEVTASGATAAVKGTFDKTIKVVVDIFVPLGAGIAGFFMPTVLGGGYSISNAIYAATNRSGPAGTIDRVAWGVQALINAAVGAAFWSLRKMDGIIAKAIGGAIGGFFLGGSVCRSFASFPLERHHIGSAPYARSSGPRLDARRF